MKLKVGDKVSEGTVVLVLRRRPGLLRLRLHLRAGPHPTALPRAGEGVSARVGDRRERAVTPPLSREREEGRDSAAAAAAPIDGEASKAAHESPSVRKFARKFGRRPGAREGHGAERAHRAAGRAGVVKQA